MSGEAFLGVESSALRQRWQFRPIDEEQARDLGLRLGLPELLSRILAGRGIAAERADDFLSGRLKALLPDPSTLKDMDAASSRIADAVLRSEKIAIFGDYDVDGATSAAVLARFFHALDREVTIYVPDRLAEGYGPNANALRALAASGHSVAITVDCGIAAHSALQAGREAGLDVIVVDHHLPEGELPPAKAIINPNRADDSSGQGMLAAVGVAFLLAVAINRELRQRGAFGQLGVSEPDLRQWLDVVALGTVADVVPLTGVNRAFVRQGLSMLSESANPGLRALMEVAGVGERPGVYHLGFILGPRINAGGRVGKSDLGARLLSTDDASEAQALAKELDRLNRERQAIEAMMLQRAAEMIGPEPADPIIIAAGEGWHPGVVGIIASRLKDRYRRPVVAIAAENGVGRGSARSIPGIDLGSMIQRAYRSGLLLAGGGHKMAAGLSLTLDRLPEFQAFLLREMAAQASDLSAVPVLELDGAVAVSGAGVELCQALDRAGPYGAGHPEPCLAIPSAKIIRADIVGERHVRCILNGADGARLDGIAFRAMESALGPFLLSHAGRVVHLAGALKSETWQQKHRVQLHIEDAATGE